MTAESFDIEMLSESYSVLSIQQATVNKQDLFYNFWLFHSLPSKSQDNHITITQWQAGNWLCRRSILTQLAKHQLIFTESKFFATEIDLVLNKNWPKMHLCHISVHRKDFM